MYEFVETIFSFLFVAIGGVIVLLMVILGLNEAVAQKRHMRAIERSKYDL